MITERHKDRVEELLKKHGPMNCQSIADLMGMSRAHIGWLLKRMPGRAYVCGWEGKIATPVFAAGRGENAPKPENALQAAERILSQTAMTATELAAAAGKSHQAMLRAINQLGRKVPVRIDSWHVHKGPHAPRYVIGEGPDAIKPEPTTPLQRVHKYRATAKGQKTNIRHAKRYQKTVTAKENRKKRTQFKAQKKKIQEQGLSAVDPLMAAILGVK